MPALRSRLIRLASTMPKSAERQALLSMLGGSKVAKSTSRLKVDAEVTVTKASGVGEGKARLVGTVKTKASGLYGNDGFDVEVEWGTFGPVVTKTYKGGPTTAFVVGAACQTTGPVHEALTAVL